VTVGQVLTMMGATLEEYETEAEYISDIFGFTLDLADHKNCIIIDWETVEDKAWYRQPTGKGGSRKPKGTEALQLAAERDTLQKKYGKPYRVANAYIGRQSSKLVALVEWPSELCDFMAREVMPIAFKAYTLAEECKTRIALINKNK